MVRPTTPPASKPAATTSAEFELHHWRTPSSIRRRTGDAGAPSALDLTSSPAPKGDAFGYTSLRELLGSPLSSASILSPSASADQIRIKNRLVKHAAYAYLQPTPSATDAAASSRRSRGAAALWRACASCFCFLRLLIGR